MRHLTILACASLAVLAATQASAQTRAAAPTPGRAATAAPAISHGPAIPGVCILSVDRAIAQSSVGQFVRTRLQQLAQQVSSELQPEDTALSTDVKALQAQRATLDQATLQSRGQALQTRATAFQQKYELRQRELQATQEKAFNRVAQELDPIAQQLYQQHRCSVLLNRQAVLIANPEMDVTAGAVTGLNAKITQFSFEREHLDTAAAPAAR